MKGHSFHLTLRFISGFLLNLRFMHGELTASTGVSYRTFSTDKSLEFGGIPISGSF